MTDLKKMRELLGQSAEGMTDEQLTQLYSATEAFAHLIFDMFKRGARAPAGFVLTPEQRAAWTRAGAPPPRSEALPAHKALARTKLGKRR
jgi:hypothetical protein